MGREARREEGRDERKGNEMRVENPGKERREAKRGVEAILHYCKQEKLHGRGCVSRVIYAGDVHYLRIFIGNSKCWTMK